MTGQMTLPVSEKRMESPDGLLTAALTWIDENPEAWHYIVKSAQLDALEIGRIRVKSYVEFLRYKPLPYTTKRIKLPNAFSAPLGRILAEWYPELAHAIPLNASKCDGLTIPPRPSWA